MATKKVESTAKGYNISARITVDVSVETDATSFDEALSEAKKLEVTDFITIDGEYLDDQGVQLRGIYLS
jgi:hypothetical protein